MNSNVCAFEDELLEALQRRFLPRDLAAHLDGCASCAELRRIAGALLDDRVHAIAEAPVPSAATMWWRIQLRRQKEAEAASRRSLLVGQAATLAIALLLVVALFGVDMAEGVRHALASIRVSMPLLVGLAAGFILAPLAGYVAIRQK